MREDNENRGKTAAIDRILAAAQTEFANQGFESVNVQQIADAAGVSTKLVYHYFGRKENLYLESLIRMAEGFFDKFKVIESNSLHPLDVIYAFAFQYADFYIENPETGRLILDQVIHGGKQIARNRPLEKLREGVFDVLRQALADGRRLGIVRDGISAEGLFFHILVVTLGYGTISTLLGPLHLEVKELQGEVDLRRIISEAAVAFVRVPEARPVR